MRKKTASKVVAVTLVYLIMASVLGALPSTIAGASNFNIGDTVGVTTNLNVRTGPSTSNPEITDPDYPGYAPAGTEGRVLDGPINADGYTWWKVDFGPGLYSGWSVEGGLETVVSTTISAQIDSYSPSNLVEVTVGGSTTISVTFTNTGNTAWNFIAGATVWNSGGSQVANYSKTLSSALQPGQQTTVSWTHPVNQAGDYWLQFGVWKATPYTAENLLDKKPSPSQNLIRGPAAPQPTIDYSPSSFSFSATQGGSNPSSQTLNIRNSGGGTLIWSVSDAAGWLSLSPTSSTSTGETDSVAVSVSISEMSAGSYSATITISASGATNTPQTVPVSLTINPPSTVAARIDSYSPSSLVEVTAGSSTTISVTFTNNGNTAWNFIAGATVWDSGGSQVANYSKTLSSALQPGQQTTVSWTHPVNQEGDYWLQFGVWKATPYTSENLLDKKPSPSQNLIRGVIQANQSPTCSISANPRSGNVPLTVTFSISASDADGSISAWVLDVDGDGNADYSGTGTPPSTKSHTYNNIGAYSVVLMVSDDKGDNASDTEMVNVGSANQPPTCSLSATPSSGNAPLTVSFSMSAGDSDGSISAWALDVNGDGINDYSGSDTPPSTLAHTYSTQGDYTVILIVSDNDDATASDTAIINVESSISGPDLVVSGITWTPASPSIGDTVTFTVTIKNQGTVEVGSSKVYYFIDDIQKDYDYVNSLDPGAITTETFTWQVQAGIHTIKAIADYQNSVSESDEDNNEKAITFSSTALSDLIIESVTWSPLSPSIGDTVTFTFSIKNQGSGEAGSSKVYYFIDNYEQDYDYVGSLDPGATTTETFTWYAQDGEHIIKAIADYENNVSESDETNNEKNILLGTALSDLVIESITWSPVILSIDDVVNFTVIIKNQGIGEANSSAVYFFIDNIQQDYDYVSSLEPGATTTETFSWYAQDGEHTVMAVADYNDEVTEGDETNNETTVTVGRPNVLARIDSHSPAAPIEMQVGEPVILGVTFTNAGNTAWTYYAAVSLRGSDGTEEHLLLEPVSLDPNQQGGAAWTYKPDMEGKWDIVFRIWQEEAQVNSLEHAGWLNDYIVCIKADDSAPRVDSLSVQRSSITQGDSFTISYSVSDTGGSGLNRVELWRADDSNGSPVNWVEITRTSASGSSDSGSFTDTPYSAGFYWYGIHAADNAGNWISEDSPVRVEVMKPNTIDIGSLAIPQMVFISAVSLSLPEGKITDIEFDKYTYDAGDSVRINIGVRNIGIGRGQFLVHLYVIDPSGKVIASNDTGIMGLGGLLSLQDEGSVQWLEPSQEGEFGPFTLVLPRKSLFSIEAFPGKYHVLARLSTGVFHNIALDYRGIDLALPEETFEVRGSYEGTYEEGETLKELKDSIISDLRQLEKVAATAFPVSVEIPDPDGDDPTDTINLVLVINPRKPLVHKYMRVTIQAEVPPDYEGLLDNTRLNLTANLPSSFSGCTETFVAREIMQFVTNFREKVSEEIALAILDEIIEKTGAGPLGSMEIAQLILDVGDCTAQGEYVIRFAEDVMPGAAVQVYLPVDIDLSIRAEGQIHFPWTHAESTPPVLPSHVEGSWRGILLEGAQENRIKLPLSVYLAGGASYLLEPKDFEFVKQVKIESPAELRVYDSQGRVTGLVDGEVRNTIPKSMYDSQSETVTIFNATDEYRCQVIGTQEGTYQLWLATLEEKEATAFRIPSIATSSKETHEYMIDWDVISEGVRELEVQIDSDGDGNFEQVVRLSITEEGKGGLPIWAWICIGVVISLVIAFGVRRYVFKNGWLQIINRGQGQK